jgi:hypothetical protein
MCATSLAAHTSMWETVPCSTWHVSLSVRVWSSAIRIQRYNYLKSVRSLRNTQHICVLCVPRPTHGVHMITNCDSLFSLFSAGSGTERQHSSLQHTADTHLHPYPHLAFFTTQLTQYNRAPQNNSITIQYTTVKLQLILSLPNRASRHN